MQIHFKPNREEFYVHQNPNGSSYSDFGICREQFQ